MGQILETQTESFFERALSNLSGAWRDIAASAARTIGRGDLVGVPRDRKALRKLMSQCLEARGGEVSARMRAAELGESYLELDGEGRQVFFEILAHDFAVDPELIAARIEAYQAAAEAADKLALEAELRERLGIEDAAEGGDGVDEFDEIPFFLEDADGTAIRVSPRAAFDEIEAERFALEEFRDCLGFGGGA